MSAEATRRRFVLQTVGMIGGTMVAGDLLPLLAEAAKRKQVLRVALERDFETLRPELSAGDTINMLRRLIYTTPIRWGTKQRPDGSLIYDPNTIEPVLASSYKVSEDRQLIEFTLHSNAKFANGNPINAQAFKDSYAWFLATRGSGQLRVNGLPSADRIEVVDDVMVRLYLDRPVAWGLIGNALLKNALMPVITFVGWQIGFLIGGVVLIEVVFALPGIGRYAVDSLLVNDFAPVQGFVLVVLVVYLCVNLLADVLYGLVNPQVRATME
jgi:ABC-type transport system substrate-binding protein